MIDVLSLEKIVHTKSLPRLIRSALETATISFHQISFIHISQINSFKKIYISQVNSRYLLVVYLRIDLYLINFLHINKSLTVFDNSAIRSDNF